MPTLTELAQLGKQALLAFVAQLLTEFAALKTRVEELLAELSALKARVTELLTENAALKARLEQRTRDAKRQAAPFVVVNSVRMAERAETFSSRHWRCA